MNNYTGYAIAFDKCMKKCERDMKTHLIEFMNCESRITIKNGMNNDFVERWANFVKTHPRAVWKKQVGPLIDAQIMKPLELLWFQAFEDSPPSK